MAKDEDILKDALECFDLAVENEAENREEALDDLKFARLGEQWPEKIKRDRERQMRPCLTINRMPSFIRQVVNDSRQNKPSIKVHPVDSAGDPETAEIISGLIRNIETASNADVAYDTGIEFAVTMGFGYWRVKMDYAHDDTFDMDICIDRVTNPFSVYGDPYSTAADSSDWSRAFVVDQLRKEDFRKKYKGAEEVDWKSTGYEDLRSPWFDGDRVQVAEYWERSEVARKIVLLSTGEIIDADQFQKAKDYFDAMNIVVRGERDTRSWKVIQRILTGAEVLETNEWAGKYIPIIPVYGDEVNVEGKRYLRSLIRDAKDPQRMFNYWRTTSTELIALAPRTPFIGKKGAFKSDMAKWQSANVESHAFIEYDGEVPPQRQPFAGPPAGALQEALNASDDMKSVMGLYDASLGARSNETSGRAIIARQREGDTSTFHFLDNLSRAIRHTGRVVIDLIPHVYSGERIIRVLGPEEEAETVQLGKPTTRQSKPGSQETRIERIYDLSIGKYDLTVETGPSFTTKREEAATQMTELIRAYPQVAPLIGDLLAKNLDWPGADEIAKRMQAMLPPQIKGEDPAAQQMQQQFQQAIQELHQKLTEASKQVESLKADKFIEVEKTKIDAYNAETNRLKVTQAGLTPEQVQMLVVQTLQQVLTSPDVFPGVQQPTPQSPVMAPPQPQGIPNNAALDTNQQGVL